jgi:hypothetical protein
MIQSKDGDMDLLLSLVNSNPEERASALDVLNSPFMAPLREMEGCAYSKDDEVMSKLFYYRDCFNRTLIHHHTVLILETCAEQFLLDSWRFLSYWCKTLVLAKHLSGIGQFGSDPKPWWPLIVFHLAREIHHCHSQWHLPSVVDRSFFSLLSTLVPLACPIKIKSPEAGLIRPKSPASNQQ